MIKRPIDELVAGDEFRNSLIARADSWKGTAPLWYGWAIMDAFLAGIEYGRRGGRDTLLETDNEIKRLQAALELIAGSSTDKLQALQARAALTNIGAAPELKASESDDANAR